MVYKVNKNIIKKILEELPFLRYNDTRFFAIDEFYYSKSGKKEIPWNEPKEAIVHRIVSEIKLEKCEFEENKDAFIDFLDYLFDESKPKMFEYAKHVLMTGEQSNVLATEITFWPVVETIFEKVDLSPYLTCNRILARIPCGMLNLNLTKLNNSNDFYLEITSLNLDYESLDKLKRDLELDEPITESWGELALKSPKNLNIA